MCVKKTVFISGHFNVLHPGHIRLFKFAKSCGDRLIVGVESDRVAGKDAYIDEKLRLEAVSGHSFVDEAFIFDQPLERLLAQIQPNIVVKGKEHESKFNIEESVLAGYGGEIRYGSGDLLFSSADLIQKELLTKRKSIVSLPSDYMDRHKIIKKDIANVLDKFSKLKVIVVGDLIIDEYISCQPLGMSQEDPTIVVSPIETKRYIGGAGIVAAHAAGLGADTQFISFCGDDEGRDFALEVLKKYGVNVTLLKDPSRPTTLKKRYRAESKTLLRVSYLHQDAMPKNLQTRFVEKVLSALNNANCLIFSDFNYGCLPQEVVDTIILEAKKRNILVSADSQSSSQIGDIARYRSIDLITPTEREARVSLKNQDDGLVILAEKLKTLANAKNILLKMGGDGVLVQSSASESGIYTDQIPALNLSPKDVAGAGDSLLITASLALAVGANIWQMGLIGSMAAAVQVGRLGNTPLSSGELKKELLH